MKQLFLYLTMLTCIVITSLIIELMKVVIFLVDRVTTSAAEDLIAPFKDNGRATIVGETTAGSTGQPYNYLTECFFIGIGVVRANMPNGDSFEGVGIEPDISVAITRNDLVEDKDVFLSTALEYYKNCVTY